MKTGFECLIKFTKGHVVTCGDHRWVPVAHGVVAYTYRERDHIEIDIVEAAKNAGSIIDRRLACDAVWGV